MQLKIAIFEIKIFYAFYRLFISIENCHFKIKIFLINRMEKDGKAHKVNCLNQFSQKKSANS